MNRGVFRKKIVGKLSLVVVLFAQGCTGNSSEQSQAPAHHVDIKTIANRSDVMPLVIIGSGVAGLGAAIHAARSRVKTVVIRGDEPGGLLTKTTFVENWPGAKPTLGRDIIGQLSQQAEELGGALISFMDDTVESIDFAQWPYVIHLQGGDELKVMSIIIATGATPTMLKVPGEQEYWGRGVTTCAICDAPFYKDKDVVVVGGGDSAVEEAIQLLQYARNVTILVRKDQMRAGASSQERLRSISAIKVRYGVEVQSIDGDGNHVTGVTLKNVRDGATEKLATDGVFLAIGHSPNAELVAGAVERDPKGYIVLKGRTQETSKIGVFAAGEVDDPHYRQADVEVAEGKKAAMDAVAFLYENGFSDEPQVKKTVAAPGQYRDVVSFDQVKELAQGQKFTALYFADPQVPESMSRATQVLSLAQQVDPSIVGAKVVVSQASELSDIFHVDVEKVPCLIVVNSNGKPVGRYSGQMSEIDVLKFVKEVVRNA